MRCLLLLVGLLLATTAAAAEKSPWAVEFAGNRGVSLSYGGVPLIRQSTLYVVKPGWSGLHYDQRVQRHSLSRGEGSRPALTVVGQNDVFRAEYRLEALDDRRFRLRFEGRLLKDVPAEMEYAAGYFNANLIANRPYRAETAAGKTGGVVPAFPASSDQAKNDLAPGFRRLEWDSRLGRLSLEARSDQRVMFFDARRDAQEWARSAPVFWCGLGAPARRLQFGRPVTLELILTVDAKPTTPLPALRATPTVTPVSAAESTRERPFRVIPQPKSLALTQGPAFHLRPGLELSLTGPADNASLETLREAVPAVLPVKPGMIRERPGTGGRTTLRFGTQARDAAPPDRDAEWARNPEGYRLTAKADGIEIVASTPQGAYYGLQTLAQLLRPAEGGGYTCPAVKVEDWPSLAFRGAHWFPSASGTPFHRKLIERVMARYKLNHAVIQCEAARWESHPEIAAPNSVSKADLRGLVALSRRHFIEPVPLVNTPGHAEWMFRNGQNLDLAEDRETPYAYCVNHPRSDVFIKEILGEALEVFRPRTFHLGHDEVTMRGRFPHPECPRCRGKGVTELVTEHAQRLGSWLEQRGVRTMVWGDMLLAKEEVPDAAHAPSAAEARARRAALPRGFTVADWHYGAGSSYPSLALLHASGFATVASTWHDPLNVYHFTRAALAARSRGVLQTTWSGYFPDEAVLETELRQFAAFILAAEYAWSGRSEPPSALPYNAGTEFTRAYLGDGGGGRSGAVVDLGKVRRPRTDWRGLGPGWDLGALPSGERRLEDVLFRLPKGGPVLLGSRLSSEGARSLTLELGGKGRRARQVALLNAAAWAVPAGNVSARMIVEYAEGAPVTFDLVTGRTTASWTEDTPALRAAVGWRVASPADTPLALRLTRWENPHPEREIARLRFKTVDPEAGWLLAGVTLLD